MSWEFHSTSNLLFRRSESPTRLYLWFLSNEDYKYNLQILVLIEVSFKVIPLNSYYLMNLWHIPTNDLGIGNAYV
jgi:hypothetical protein